MNDDELVVMVAEARERQAWVTSANAVHEPYNREDGTPANHTIGIFKRGEQDFVADAPRAIVALAERVAALEAERDRIDKVMNLLNTAMGLAQPCDHPSRPQPSYGYWMPDIHFEPLSEAWREWLHDPPPQETSDHAP
jgi:hypothetical protein